MQCNTLLLLQNSTFLRLLIALSAVTDNAMMRLVFTPIRIFGISLIL